MQEEVLKNESKVFIPGKAGRIEALISSGPFILNPNPNPNLNPNLNLDPNSNLNLNLNLNLDWDPRKAPEVGIVCHPHPLYQGTMHNKVVTSITRAWQSLGIQSIRFNFRGVGESEGEYGEGIGEIADLKSVLEWVLSKDANTKIWLAGFSFGAYVALKMAVDCYSCSSLERPSLQGLFSIGSPLSLFDFTKIELPKCPWLVIHGDQDELTPLVNVQAWYEKTISMGDKYKKMISVEDEMVERPFYELLVVPGASHFFHGKLLELKQAIVDFTRRVLLGPNLSSP